MNPPSFFSSIQKTYATFQKERSAVIHASNDALGASKRAIFALHRGDPAGAAHMLAEADRLFKTVEARQRRIPELADEGAYAAAIEEYAEARLFESYVKTGAFGKGEPRTMQPHTFLAGLSDATGEIVRYAVRQATIGNEQEVERAHAAVEMAIGFLLELDLTGYLRQKFDQAKRNVSALEDMLFDIRLRRR